MVVRKIMIYSKSLTPILLGLCLGLALSIVFAPSLEDGCQLGAKQTIEIGEANGEIIRKPNSFGNDDFDYGNSDDFEPRIRTLDKNTIAKKGSQKTLLRPRYASTELGIKEKLFVGILTSKDTIDTFGTAINKTLTHFVPKLVFFMNSRGPVLPSGLSVVIFSNEEAHMVPFHMMKYIADHYLKNFDWFYFITDDSYVRGEKIMEFVEQLSISKDLYIGRSYTTSDSPTSYCDIGGGILLSQNVINEAIENLNWCRTTAVAGKMKDSIAQCIHHASNQQCSQGDDTSIYKAYNMETNDFDQNILRLNEMDEFRNAVSIQNVKDDISIYKLHRYYCEMELNKTRFELQRKKQDIIDLAPQTPAGEEGLSWPIGIDPPSATKTRFDVIKWEYFTESHIYLDSELHNGKSLNGVDKIDVQDVLHTSIEKLNEKYRSKFIFAQLVNGYRRFDPGRGMEYILDLGLRIKGTKEEVIKRVHLLRPLSFVEIVPMPYVTESSRVNLILPVKLEDRDNVVSFLDSYATTCLDSGDNTHLYVVFLYNDANPMINGEEDSFSVLKSMMSFYESKYQNGARIAWTALHHNNPSEFTVMDAISKKFSKETLFLMCSVGMELSIEFLNRVRMNTIANWQVFFPIAFWQFKPNLIYDKPQQPEIKISALTGHFDEDSYIHGSFYNSDYHYARKQMIATSATQDIDLYDMFLKYHNIHVFRAVEPALKHKFREQQCQHKSEDVQARCVRSRNSGLASRQKLAMLIFEHENSVDQAQMNILHQQNDPQIDHMKPNMLKRK